MARVRWYCPASSTVGYEYEHMNSRGDTTLYMREQPLNFQGPGLRWPPSVQGTYTYTSRVLRTLPIAAVTIVSAIPIAELLSILSSVCCSTPEVWWEREKGEKERERREGKAERVALE